MHYSAWCRKVSIYPIKQKSHNYIHSKLHTYRIYYKILLIHIQIYNHTPYEHKNLMFKSCTWRAYYLLMFTFNPWNCSWSKVGDSWTVVCCWQEAKLDILFKQIMLNIKWELGRSQDQMSIHDLSCSSEGLINLIILISKFKQYSWCSLHCGLIWDSLTWWA